MIDLLILFAFLTGAIAATLFFIQGAVHVARYSYTHKVWHTDLRKFFAKLFR